MSVLCLARLARVFSVWVVVAVAASVHADTLDPLDFSSLGTLNLSGGAYTIDTDALTIVDDAAPGTPLFTGVLDDQRGLADSFGPGGGVTTVGPMGVPHIAVFTFDGITLQSSANITVTGHRALALLSKGSALVDTTIDVSGGAGGLAAPFPAGAGRAGGFDGGYGSGDGIGPGGGEAPASENVGGITGAAGGSFGSQGAIGLFPSGSEAQPGPSYGDLSNLLQGGSGGGGVHGTFPAVGDVGGGAGGGALEIGAAEALVVGPNGELIASGGKGTLQTVSQFNRREGGGGSGGGIRLHGATVSSTGQILAKGAPPVVGVGDGGGGRVLIYGIHATLAVGEDLPDISPYGIDVASNYGAGSPVSGVIVVSPELTVVPTGQSLELGGPPVVMQVASTTQPRIEVMYGGNVRADRGAELIVPAGGFISSHRIELGGGSARITGSDSLTNVTRGELRGSGSVEVEFINDAGGQINATNDSLIFMQAVTNNVGAQINAINSTLDFQAGLTNNGQLNLINTTILGSINGGATSATSFVSDNSVGGNLAMSPGDALTVRLGGTSPTQFDALSVGGNASLAGSLSVSLTGGFTLAPSQSFTIVDIAGITAGGFASVDEGALVGSFGGTELFITYAGGDGNDVTVFTLPPGVPGDFNLDGAVNAADYVVWRKGAGVVSTPENYNLWRTNFGRTTGGGGSAAPGSAGGFSAAVPEPNAISVCLLALVAILARRGNRSVAKNRC